MMVICIYLAAKIEEETRYTYLEEYLRSYYKTESEFINNPTTIANGYPYPGEIEHWTNLEI
jgi:hypothetical protein